MVIGTVFFFKFILHDGFNLVITKMLSQKLIHLYPNRTDFIDIWYIIYTVYKAFTKAV